MGEWDVDSLVQKMPAWQFERWYQLYCAEPWGPERSDLAAGVQIMHATAAAGVQPREPAAYMPYLARHCEPEKPQTENEIRQVFDTICAARAQALQEMTKDE